MEKVNVIGSVAYRLEDGTPVPYVQYQFEFMAEEEPQLTGAAPSEPEAND